MFCTALVKRHSRSSSCVKTFDYATTNMVQDMVRVRLVLKDALKYSESIFRVIEGCFKGDLG